MGGLETGKGIFDNCAFVRWQLKLLIIQSFNNVCLPANSAGIEKMTNFSLKQCLG